ncbi:hypothetical protein [Curtobacterium sp. MCBA15_001]|uniref:hypothetical protein n=1 Tax=Curtobacterium sp. MCBA15_001 TaxID=1898731 RepID=UPI0011142C52|nr:hypothetical protein [Curtobacterium sp. MCBA15_001]
MWFVNGEPARLVVDGQRWRIIADTVQTHRGELPYIPPMLTHAPQNAVIGYEFTAERANGGQQQAVTIHAEGHSWVLG